MNVIHLELMLGSLAGFSFILMLVQIDNIIVALTRIKYPLSF